MSKGQKFRIDSDGVMRPVMTDDGREIPDSTPMAPPIGFKRQAPLHERIRAMVRHEYELASKAAQVESFDEADDFVIPGEDDPREGRFAMMPGYEWEENYEPPKDWDDMRNRLVQAGWTPPAPKDGQEPSATDKTSGKAPSKVLDDPKAPDNRSEAAPASGSKS